MDAPRLCIHDNDIEKYTGKKIDEINVDDTLTLAITCKVVGVEKRKEFNGPPVTEGGKDEKEAKEKTVSRLDLVVTGAPEKPKEVRISTGPRRRF